MAFSWAYFHADKHWRKTWAGKLETTKTLSRHFQIIVDALEARKPTLEIMTRFSDGRDAFRDILSEKRPQLFKRYGTAYASLADVIDSLASNDLGPSRYFSIFSSCGGQNCNTKVTTPGGAPYLLRPATWASITHSKHPPHHESLQEWVSGWFDLQVSLRPGSCPQCQRDCSLTSLFLHPPWIWFEVFFEQSQVIFPDFNLTFSSYTYRLAAAIYGNHNHFVARLNIPSGAWWFYDGMINGGRPTPISVTCKEELLTCGGDGYVLTALVYCLSG